MGKSWPQNEATNCLYLFAWASLCVLLILFFKLSSCNGPETELKWKTDIENLYNIWILSYTGRCCLVPFSSNIYCNHKHNVHLCCDYRGNRVIFQSPNKQFFSSERSTQQANYYMKHTVTNRIPVTATLIRVNEALDWNLLTKHFEWRCMVNVSWEENETSQLLSIKTNKQLFRRVQIE